MPKVYNIFLASVLVIMGFGINAGKNAFEGRAVYHSSCSISSNPVQYETHTGTVSVRRWWYVDTITGAKIKATKAQHEACESVKVLMSSEAEVAEAERLEEVANNWILFSFAWLGLAVLVEVATSYLAKRRERLEWERADRERELEWKRDCEMWKAKREAEEAERQRSKTANEERARRKAERGAILEARRLANLERKKG